MKRILATVSILALGGSMALAAGSSGSSNNLNPPVTPAPVKLKCKQGEVVKEVKGKPTCVKAKESMLDDKELYEQGYQLAKYGEYDWAITVLSAAQNQNDPDVLNMLGYSNRKAGRLDVGISYYTKALAERPDFARAREYLGEGYVAAGKLSLANAQLDEIAKICGMNCQEYRDLEKVITFGGGY